MLKELFTLEGIRTALEKLRIALGARKARIVVGVVLSSSIVIFAVLLLLGELSKYYSLIAFPLFLAGILGILYHFLHQGGAAPRSALKLIALDEADRELLVNFGRNVDIEAVCTLVKTARDEALRTCCLWGESGVGKTSLLQGGVMPALREAGIACAYVRPQASLPAAILAAVEKVPSLKQGSKEMPHGLSEFLVQAQAEIGQPLVVIIDQFEEVFSQSDGQRACSELIQAAHSFGQELDITFLLAIRQADYHQLSNLSVPSWLGVQHFPLLSTLNPRNREHKLTLLSRVDAHRLLLNRYGERFDQALIEAMIDDLSKDDRVLPIEMALLDACIRSEGIYRYVDYRARGGKNELVAAHLRKSIDRSEGPRLAMQIFRVLAAASSHTPSTSGKFGTQLTVDEIAARVNESVQDVQRCLAGFVKAGFIAEQRPDELEGAPKCYQLAHAYLAEKFLDVMSSTATMRANRTLEHAIRYRQTIPVSQLLWPVLLRANLQEFGSAGKEVLFASAVAGVRFLAILIVAPVMFLLLVNQFAAMHFEIREQRIVLARGFEPLKMFTWSRDDLIETGYHDRDVIGDPGPLTDTSVLRFRRVHGHQSWGNALAPYLEPAVAAELLCALGDHKGGLAKIKAALPRTEITEPKALMALLLRCSDDRDSSLAIARLEANWSSDGDAAGEARATGATTLWKLQDQDGAIEAIRKLAGTAATGAHKESQPSTIDQYGVFRSTPADAKIAAIKALASMQASVSDGAPIIQSILASSSADERRYRIAAEACLAIAHLSGSPKDRIRQLAVAVQNVVQQYETDSPNETAPPGEFAYEFYGAAIQAAVEINAASSITNDIFKIAIAWDVRKRTELITPFCDDAMTMISNQVGDWHALILQEIGAAKKDPDCAVSIIRALAGISAVEPKAREIIAQQMSAFLRSSALSLEKKFLIVENACAAHEPACTSCLKTTFNLLNSPTVSPTDKRSAVAAVRYCRPSETDIDHISKHLTDHLDMYDDATLQTACSLIAEGKGSRDVSIKALDQIAKKRVALQGSASLAKAQLTRDTTSVLAVIESVVEQEGSLQYPVTLLLSLSPTESDLEKAIQAITKKRSLSNDERYLLSKLVGARAVLRNGNEPWRELWESNELDRDPVQRQMFSYSISAIVLANEKLEPNVLQWLSQAQSDPRPYRALLAERTRSLLTGDRFSPWP